jgi:hypothetical protein
MHSKREESVSRKLFLYLILDSIFSKTWWLICFRYRNLFKNIYISGIFWYFLIFSYLFIRHIQMRWSSFSICAKRSLCSCKFPSIKKWIMRIKLLSDNFRFLFFCNRLQMIFQFLLRLNRFFFDWEVFFEWVFLFSAVFE